MHFTLVFVHIVPEKHGPPAQHVIIRVEQGLKRYLMAQPRLQHQHRCTKGTRGAAHRAITASASTT